MEVSYKITYASEQMHARISSFRLLGKFSSHDMLNKRFSEAQNHIHIGTTCIEGQKAAYLKRKYFQVAQKLRKPDFIFESSEPVLVCTGIKKAS